MSVQRPLRRRMWHVLALLVLAYGLFLWKSYRLQIVFAEEHLARAQWGVESVSRYEGARGVIVDRDGRILAGAAPAVTLAYDPRLLLTEDRAQLDTVLPLIAGFERFDAADMAAWRTAEPQDVPRFRVLERGVPPAVANQVLDRLSALGVRAVFQQDASRRTYPNGPLAGRTLGFLDAFGSAGVAGIEMAFEELLAGEEVEVRVARDASREPYLLGEVPDLAAAAGATVHLTLDAELQAVAEQALRDTLDEFDAAAGTVVVSRVETGEVLVMASAPDFDPNAEVDGDSIGWRNPAVANMYEPGSTAKMLTFAAALEEGVIAYDTEFDCENGVVMVDRYRIRDRHCHDSILAWEAIRESSNIGALKMGMRMEQSRHRDYLTAFGLGARTGVPLPGEAAGVVPTLERPWPESRHATVSYGYGFSVTPLQLNIATATIANGGVRMEPLLVSSVVDAAGEVRFAAEPTPVGRVVSENTAELVTRALETVVSADGTAALASVPGHRVAGKTGTARLLAESGGYEEGAYLAAFTGYLPADAPRFAITVMVERPDPEIGYYGGVVAAPVFAAVARRALELDGLHVAEDGVTRPVEHSWSAEVTHGLETPVGSRLAIGERTVPNFVGLTVREAMVAAAGTGINIAVEGAGRVADQAPAAGTPATPDTHVVLTLTEVRR